jgi:hypothetical protein
MGDEDVATRVRPEQKRYMSPTDAIDSISEAMGGRTVDMKKSQVGTGPEVEAMNLSVLTVGLGETREKFLDTFAGVCRAVSGFARQGDEVELREAEGLESDELFDEITRMAGGEPTGVGDDRTLPGAGGPEGRVTLLMGLTGRMDNKKRKTLLRTYYAVCKKVREHALSEVDQES